MTRESLEPIQQKVLETATSAEHAEQIFRAHGLSADDAVQETRLLFEHCRGEFRAIAPEREEAA